MAEVGFQTEVLPVPDMPNVDSFFITGRVTFLDAHILSSRLLHTVATTSASKLVIDLSGIEKMDTSGIAVLVEALILGRQRSLKILFCTPSDAILQLFRLAGLEDMISSCSSCPEETRRRLRE